MAVAAPPVALFLESHAPGAHARRIENVHEADGSVGRRGARRNAEIDSFVLADRLQRIRQRGVLDAGIPPERQFVDIEKPLTRYSFGRAAAGRLRAFEVRVVDHGQAAVETFQSEGDRVEGGERR